VTTCKMSYKKSKSCVESIDSYIIGGGLNLICKIQGSNIILKKCPIITN